MSSMEKREERLPFEQLPKESTKAFAAFKAYLDMGPQRSLALVGKQLGKSKNMMEQWSRKFDWVERVQAYNRYVANIEREAIEGLAVEKAVEWVKLHEPVKREAWEEATKTIEMVRQARAEWMAKGRLPGWEGMARMLELAFKLKQFAAGMASEVKEVNTTVTGTIDVEWEVAIRKAYGVPVAPAMSAPGDDQGNAKSGERRAESERVIDVEEVPKGNAETLKPEILKSNGEEQR
jgi:hypothetical protein